MLNLSSNGSTDGENENFKVLLASSVVIDTGTKQKKCAKLNKRAHNHPVKSKFSKRDAAGYKNDINLNVFAPEARAKILWCFVGRQHMMSFVCKFQGREQVPFCYPLRAPMAVY